jgi:hypothetical protein
MALKEWYSPEELAGLPGMPSSPEEAAEMAVREGWITRPRVKYFLLRRLLCVKLAGTVVALGKAST